VVSDGKSHDQLQKTQDGYDTVVMYSIKPTQRIPSWGSGLQVDLGRPVPAQQLNTVVQMVDYAVPAGFPSMAEEHIIKRQDLVELLSSHPQATHFIRASGHSMQGAGIFDRDILTINCALEPQHNDIVVACLDYEFTCKYLYKRAGRIRLVPANPAYPDIRPKDGQVLEIWGVVTATTRLFRAHGSVR
jgi:DNA polymerase V